MENITRIPRPLGTTALSKTYQLDRTKNNRTKLNNVLIRAYINQTLLYPYKIDRPKTLSRAIDPTRKKPIEKPDRSIEDLFPDLSEPTIEDPLSLSPIPKGPKLNKNKRSNIKSTTSLTDIPLDITNEDDIDTKEISMIQLRVIELKEFSICMGYSQAKVLQMVENKLARDSVSFIEQNDLNQYRMTSRATNFLLKKVSLGELRALSLWEEEVRHITRSQGYKAGHLKEANSLLGLKLQHLDRLIAMTEKDAGLNHQEPNTPTINITNNNALVSDSSQYLTVNSAIQLMEQKGLNHTSQIDYQTIEQTYLMDSDIPDIKAIPSDAQGVARISPLELAMSEHENRREMEIGSVVDGTLDE